MQQSHSSVKHWNDIIGALPFWMETSVSYLDDTFFYLVWVMQEVYCIPEQFDSLFFL
ncbi:hypothetical protein OZD66_00735 [Wolbachia endosymbiont of Drosophila baimaii]|nr:hypothetical protein [Wolbachia endosymbiont of Drosophila baimaii]